MILLIDNYDSFVYNLACYVGRLGFSWKVVRNNKITIDEIYSICPSHIIISPGPCAPAQAGISKNVVEHFFDKLPILGVCLGHQAIGEVFGAKIIRAKRPMHGMASSIHHAGAGIMASIDSPMEVGRYHSLVIDPDTLPSCLHVTATSAENEIMGIQHTQYPVFGLQFHPESVLTPCGFQLIKEFLS